LLEVARTMAKARAVLGDISGAFADGGILFPLLVLLCLQGSFSAPVLFGTAGLAYLVSGWFFKIPMAVQPLKAIAIAAVAMGASGSEIRLSGALLGVFCLLLIFADVNQLAKRIPHSLVQSVQLGLGVVLVIQGVSIFSRSSWEHIGAAFVLSLVILLFSSRPLLGWIASIGLVVGFIFPSIVSQPVVHALAASHGMRVLTILALVFPQMALTLTNSVVATADVARRYYARGQDSSRVTERNLLVSIGIGNLLSACVGGLPYCHGSGGVTAHYRGGARSSFSNAVIGVFLLGIAAYTVFSGRAVIVVGYPDFVLASLLIAVGVFHMGLARATWQTSFGKYQLAAALLAAVMTHNMLVVLVVAVFAEWIKSYAIQSRNMKASAI
jgi:SulP family sulfate permease